MLDIYHKASRHRRITMLRQSCLIYHSSLASINVKSPLSSSEYMSKPYLCISSLRLDNLPFKDFVVSAIINIPLVTRHLLASVIYSDQFLPIKDNENMAISSCLISQWNFNILYLSPVTIYLSCSLSATFMLLSLASITAVIAIYATCAISHIISNASTSPPLPLTGLPGNLVITYSIMKAIFPAIPT